MMDDAVVPAAAEHQAGGGLPAGLGQLLEGLRGQRMAEKDRNMTGYTDDREFGGAAFEIPSKTIFDSIPAGGESGGP